MIGQALSLLELGKKLFREAQEKRKKAAQLTTQLAATASEDTTTINEISVATLDPDEEAKRVIMRESQNPTENNQARWEARRIADEWIERTAEVANRYEALLAEKAQQGAQEQEGEEDLAMVDQSTIWEKMTSAFGWNPKVSVVGSTLGDRNHSTMKSYKQFLTQLPIPDKPTAKDLQQFNLKT